MTQELKPVLINVTPEERELWADLRLARLLAEKCELGESLRLIERVTAQAKGVGLWAVAFEALCLQMWHAGEALDRDRVKEIAKELDALKAKSSDIDSPSAWYCKASINSALGNSDAALDCYRRYLVCLKALTADQRARRYSPESGAYESYFEEWLRGWAKVAVSRLELGERKAARRLMARLMTCAKRQPVWSRSVLGTLLMIQGWIDENEGFFVNAWEYYSRAHRAFMVSHHWYYHLYALLGFARLSRKQGRFEEARWYLSLLGDALSGGDFKQMKQQVERERTQLEDSAIDLTVDIEHGVVRTRENEEIQVGKQFILLHLLGALCQAHQAEAVRGLSKAEIIQNVWRENYSAQAHDNKLYYNINRLRKMLEPDVTKPKYLLNWKEGYRLAPELKIRFIRPREGK